MMTYLAHWKEHEKLYLGMSLSLPKKNIQKNHMICKTTCLIT